MATLSPIANSSLLLTGEDAPTNIVLPSIKAKLPEAPTISPEREAFERFMADAQKVGLETPVEPPLSGLDSALETVGRQRTQAGEVIQQSGAETARTVSTAAGNAIAPTLERMGEQQFESEQLRAKGETGAAEAALSLATGAVGMGAAAINEFTTAVAQLGGAEDPTYYAKLSARAKDLASKLTYEPRTETGQALLAPVHTVFGVLHDFSQMASEAPIVRMFTTPDQRNLVRDAHELLTLFAADAFVRGAGGAVKESAAKFAARYRGIEKGDSVGILNAARDFTDTVRNDPVLGPSIDAARNTEQSLRNVEIAQGINPTLKPRLRAEGADILRRLNENPENIENINAAAIYAEKVRGMNDVGLLETVGRIDQILPSVDRGSVNEILKTNDLKITQTVGEDALAVSTPSQQLAVALDPKTTPKIRREILTELKQRARDTLAEGEKIAVGLERIGLSPEEVAANIKEFNKLPGRVKKPVEVTNEPAPSSLERALGIDPDVIDTNPAITKTKPASSKIEATKIDNTEPAQVADSNVTKSGEKTVPEGTYEAMLERLNQKRLPEPVPEAQQSNFSKTVQAEFDKGNIKTADDIRLLAEYRDAYDAKVKLENAPKTESTGLTREQAAAYVAEKTKPVGEQTLNKITEALDRGIDITEELDPRIRPHYEDIKNTQTKGIGSSDTRGIGDIVNDLLDIALPDDRPLRSRGSILKNEEGSLARYGLTPKQRQAIERLQADALRSNIRLRELLDKTGLPEAAKIIYERYISNTKQPLPQSAITPTNVALDPEAVARGDTIVVQRKLHGGKTAVPVYGEEAAAIINAGPIKRSNILGRINKDTGLIVPYYALREAGLLDTIGYGYRKAENAFIVERKELKADLRQIRRVIPGTAREQVGMYGLAETSVGQTVLGKLNKQVPKTLTPDQQTLYNTGKNLFADLFTRVNEIRQIIGRDELPVPSNHTLFMRALVQSELSGKGTNLLFDPSAVVTKNYSDLVATPFPNRPVRKSLNISESTDYVHLLERYSNTVLKQINLAPFTAKLNELINHSLPENGVAGRPLNQRLQQLNPETYRYLEDWRNFLVTGSNFRLSANIERVLNRGIVNLGFSILSGTLRSALAQMAALRNTVIDLGVPYTVKGIGTSIADIFSGGKERQFAFAHSKVLHSRAHEAAYNEIASSITGGNPGEFLRAIRQGRVGELQQSIGDAGYKLLSVIDREAALLTWHGAYKQAVEKLNLNGERAYNYADDAVVRTQSGTMPGDLAPIQRSVAGKFFTQFQRFVISDWNFIVNEVLGPRHLDVVQGKTSSIIKNAIRFVAATTAFNILYEDIIGTNSPLPTPARDLELGIKQGRSIVDLAVRLAGSASETVPLLSPTRYGKGFGGPVAETVREAIASAQGAPLSYSFSKEGDSLPTAIARAAGSPVAKLSGIPLANQTGKYLRGRERGQSVYSSIVGKYENLPQEGEDTNLRRLRTTSAGLRRLR